MHHVTIVMIIAGEDVRDIANQIDHLLGYCRSEHVLVLIARLDLEGVSLVFTIGWEGIGGWIALTERAARDSFVTIEGHVREQDGGNICCVDLGLYGEFLRAPLVHFVDIMVHEVVLGLVVTDPKFALDGAGFGGSGLVKEVVGWAPDFFYCGRIL